MPLEDIVSRLLLVRVQLRKDIACKLRPMGWKGANQPRTWEKAFQVDGTACKSSWDGKGLGELEELGEGSVAIA